MDRVKKINVRHPIPRRAKPYAVLPVGLYCNNRLRGAEPGAVLEIWEDRKHRTFELVRKCELPTASPVFTFVAKSLYGEHSGYRALCGKWSAECIAAGLGANGFDRDTVLLIEVKEVLK